MTRQQALKLKQGEVVFDKRDGERITVSSVKETYVSATVDTVMVHGMGETKGSSRWDGRLLKK